MKKLIVITALTLGMASASAFAYGNQDEIRYGYVSERHDGLDWRVNRLNRMLTHVRWELGHYRGDWRLRREVDRISGEVNRINWRYRHGYDSRQLRREIDRLRYRLHDIERQLHVRQGDWYRWD